ncbi:MAG: nickel pincer cofactor biosynthesis protein LarC [Verrucomicrobiae bacterium]|nr:nickel pincer cofactor biosynthesis protein LarC [Verrucomicrobiae bacterium]
MKKILYLDCFSGISGDMMMGALADLGVKPSTFEWELTKLELGDFHMHFDRKFKGAIEGVQFSCHEGRVHRHEPDGPTCDHGHHHDHHHDHGHGHHQGHGHSHAQPGGSHSHECGHDHGPETEHTHGESRTHLQIRALIEKSALTPFVKQHALGIFQRIAVAEGKIHGMAPEKVHFHEVGALDSILDIVGVCVGLEALGVEEVHASRLQEGTGFLDCAHGRFPIPSTATLEILKGIPLSQCEEPHELITPTGAALLAEFAQSFAPMRNLRTERVGYGLGQRTLASRPNVLRAVLAQAESPAGSERDTVTLIETNIDDLSPEVLGHVMEQALLRGALDCWFVPIQMKKNRPGVLVSLLVEPARTEDMARWLMRETSTFGVRTTPWERHKLQREIVRVKTPWGEVEAKVGRQGGERICFSPEFESCKRVAITHQVPLKSVYEAVLKSQEGQ